MLQLLAKGNGVPTPQRIECDMEVVQFMSRHGEKRKGATWLEMHTDDGLWLGGMDHKGVGIGTDHHTPSKKLAMVVIGRHRQWSGIIT